ncbi:calcium homeostasis modulator protein 6 [Osmerus mordax]|uniref:calcium homeostasis modulator protein 6 n=1 Tax=Osmerus mordax TaxID=8014 RepID=UPI00350EE11F
MDKFKTVLNIAQKQQESLSWGFVALVTAGGEQIFSSVVFKCPCSDWNFAYGMVFLLVPALALLVLGYSLSNRTWKLFTGICLRKSKFRCKNVFGFWVVLFQITSKAMVAPVSWIAVALLNGNYFECAMTGVNITVFNNQLCRGKHQQCQAELPLFPCKGGTVPSADKDAVLSILRAESQILGWLLIASILVSSLLLVCVSRCNSPVSYLQLSFWRSYAQQECTLLETFSEGHARELAQRNLKSFFQVQPPEPITTPSNQAWQKISNFYRFNTRDHYYSMLHQYVDNCLGNGKEELKRTVSNRSDGPDANIPAVLDFVDGAGML